MHEFFHHLKVYLILIFYDYNVLPFVLGLLSVSIRQQSQELQNGGNVNDLDKIVSNSVRARCLKECSH